MKVSNIIVLLWWKYEIKTLNKSIHNRPALSLLWFILFMHRCQILYREWLCTLCRNYKIVIQFNSHANTHMHTQMDERKFQYKRWGDFCCAPPCSSQAKELGLSAWQHVSPCIRWTSEQWFQPGAGGGYSKLWEKGVHEWLCASAWVCVTKRQRERERDRSISHLEHRDNPRWGRKLVPFLSVYWLLSLLDANAFQRGSCGAWLCLQWWHTPILKVWNEPLQGVQQYQLPPPPHPHPAPKWIDPKWDQQAKSSLFIERLLQTD